MQTTRKRDIADLLLGLFLLSHPTPVLLHIIAVSVFVLLAALSHPTWNIVLLAIAAHAAMQVSIAMTNDYCDRRLDAAGKPQKPIPRGLVRPHEALIAGLVMTVIMLLLLFPLNRLAMLITLLYLLLAQGYNAGLKATPLSGIIFALAMPLIPLYAFVAVGRTPPLLIWLVPVGFMLGIALNLANALIDIDEDAAYGARTLAVALGIRRSFVLCRLLLAAAILAIIVLTITRLVPARLWIVLLTSALAGLALACLLLAFGPEQPTSTRKLHFYVAALACIALAGGWMLAVLV